jgi:hypothetical protein
MDTSVRIEQKDCKVNISPSAEKALNSRTSPIVAEIVVTLACCIRKVVSFRELHDDESPLFITPNLAVVLVSAEHRDSDSANLPPIMNWNVLAPQWLAIDYHNGAWQGDFGYSSRNN